MLGNPIPMPEFGALVKNQVGAEETIGYAIGIFIATHPLVAIMALWLVLILMLDSLFWPVVGKVLILGLLAYVPFWLALEEGNRLAASLAAVGASLAGGAIYVTSFRRKLVWVLLVLFMVGLVSVSPLTAAVLAAVVVALWLFWRWSKTHFRTKVEEMIDEVSEAE